MRSWTDATLVALDLEGSGAQDRDSEVILEIAVVPILGGQPSMPDAYATVINPGRPVPRRPWISPGLAGRALADAPALGEIEPELGRRIAGAFIVGHNIGVDWRLLTRRCPGITTSGLLDTLRLARHARPDIKGRSLTALLDHYQLTSAVSEQVPESQPHRALWDATGAAMLLTALISDLPDSDHLSMSRLLQIAGTRAGSDRPEVLMEQPTLLDP
jgi:DNA polymerase III subunit epsilon